MRFKVPKNVDIEDRIVGPLTWKQFLWFLGAGIILFVLWKIVDQSLFIMLTIIIVLTASAFAFIKPSGKTLLSFLINVLLYNTKNKQYVWERKKHKLTPGKYDLTKDDLPKEEIVVVKKQFPHQKVQQLSEILDTEGQAGFFEPPTGETPKEITSTPETVAAVAAPSKLPADNLTPANPPAEEATIVLKPKEKLDEISVEELTQAEAAKKRNLEREQALTQTAQGTPNLKASEKLHYETTSQLPLDQQKQESTNPRSPNTHINFEQ